MILQGMVSLLHLIIKVLFIFLDKGILFFGVEERWGSLLGTVLSWQKSAALAVDCIIPISCWY